MTRIFLVTLTLAAASLSGCVKYSTTSRTATTVPSDGMASSSSAECESVSTSVTTTPDCA